MHFITTVVVHLSRIEEDIQTDKEVFEYIEGLREQLKNTWLVKAA